MDARKYIGPTFLGVGDVRDGDLRMQIAVVNTGKYDKLNLIFETGDTWSLNATNTKILSKACGFDTDFWIGKEIELFLGEVEFEKKMQPAVLVRPISPPLSSEVKKAARGFDPPSAPRPIRGLNQSLASPPLIAR